MVKDILEAYSNGNTIFMIADSFDMSEEEVLELLLSHKESSRFKKTFNEDFRIMIAERDLSGISRSDISRELKLNAGTIQKACIQYGQAIKEKANDDSIYTRIDGEFTIDVCPSCNSRKNNLVDEMFTTFCMSCDSEHEYYDGYVLKVNFEYIE